MTTKKKKTIAIILFVYPIPLLIITLVMYAIFAFVVAAVVGSGNDSHSIVIIAQIVNFLLGACGILAVAGFFIGIPIGVVLYVVAHKQEKAEGTVALEQNFAQESVVEDK
ncbi:hypothetical protein KJ673_04330 [Patescibacteria group bacterium]|nr:hypothetical protein [Patescibacteria group bacterium]MBU4453091.1 hypothetical protein [Patescibacteria group bacterium]MCG2687618.1 hypothetical protein [Candidatus Parcubacteria bacterium]